MTEPTIGHNSDKGISAQRLKSFIQRIERLEEEKKTLTADVREAKRYSDSPRLTVTIESAAVMEAA